MNSLQSRLESDGIARPFYHLYVAASEIPMTLREATVGGDRASASPVQLSHWLLASLPWSSEAYFGPLRVLDGETLGAIADDRNSLLLLPIGYFSKFSVTRPFEARHSRRCVEESDNTFG